MNDHELMERLRCGLIEKIRQMILCKLNVGVSQDFCGYRLIFTLLHETDILSSINFERHAFIDGKISAHQVVDEVTSYFAQELYNSMIGAQRKLLALKGR